MQKDFLAFARELLELGVSRSAANLPFYLAVPVDERTALLQSLNEMVHGFENELINFEDSNVWALTIGMMATALSIACNGNVELVEQTVQ